MENKIDFEKELNRLEEIANKMEDKSTSLDEALALYEEGSKITKKLEKALDEAKEKIKEAIEIK